MKLLGQKSRFPFPDRLSVHHGHRHHFHACVGEKTFVGLINRLDPKISFFNGDLCFLRKAEHDVARDAVQQAACKCRGAEPAGSDKEEIADGAFRQMRLPIEQDTVEGACRDRFPFGQDIVQKVGGLDLGWQGARQVSFRLGHDQVHAGTIVLG